MMAHGSDDDDATDDDMPDRVDSDSDSDSDSDCDSDSESEPEPGAALAQGNIGAPARCTHSESEPVSEPDSERCARLRGVESAAALAHEHVAARAIASDQIEWALQLKDGAVVPIRKGQDVPGQFGLECEQGPSDLEKAPLFAVALAVKRGMAAKGWPVAVQRSRKTGEHPYVELHCEHTTTGKRANKDRAGAARPSRARGAAPAFCEAGPSPRHCPAELRWGPAASVARDAR